MAAHRFALLAVLLASLPFHADGFVAYAVESYTSGYLLRTVNSGKNWTIVTTTAKYMEAIAFADDLRVHAVGDGGAYYTSELMNNRTQYCDPINAYDCATPWTDPPKNFTPNPAIVTPHDLSFVAFWNDNKGAIGGKLGQIYYTRDGGHTYFKQQTNTILDLNDCAISNPRGHGLIVGHQGIAFRSWDWGNHWDPISSLKSKYYTFNAAALNHNGSHAIIVGDNGVVKYSTDDAVTFGNVLFLGSFNPLLYDFLSASYFNISHGVVTGNKCMVMQTYDGGASWQQYLNFPCPLSSTTLYDVSTSTSGYGIIAARDHFYLTEDYGETWTRTQFLYHLDVNHLTQVQMVTAPVFTPHVNRIDQDSYTEAAETLVYLYFQNTGSEPLILQSINVTSYCKCVSVDGQTTPLNTPIPIGGHGQIVLVYSSAALTPGTYFSRANIYHNGPTRVFRLDTNLRLQVEIIYITLDFLQRYWLVLMLIFILGLIVWYFRCKLFIKARAKHEANRWKLRAYRKSVRKEKLPHCCVVYGCDFLGYCFDRTHSWVYHTSNKRAMDMDTDSERQRSSGEDGISSVSSVSSDEDLESFVDKVDALEDSDEVVAIDKNDTARTEMKTVTVDDDDSTDSDTTDSDNDYGGNLPNGVQITSSDTDSSD